MRRLALFGVLVGCVGGATKGGSGSTGDTGPGTTAPDPIVVDGEGFACLFGPAGVGDHAGDTELVDGGTTEVQVVFETCGSCPSDVVTACEATLQGTDVVVTATGTYTPPAPTVSCPSTCAIIAAVCPGPALAVGAWSLDYGAGTAAVTVPGTGPVPCAGDLGAR